MDHTIEDLRHAGFTERQAEAVIDAIRDAQKCGLTDALLEWRDARAAFLRCVDTAPHEDQGIPADLSRRFVDAEEKLFEVANEILML
jgi:hypothetical protein